MHNFAGKFVSPLDEVFDFFMAAPQYQKIKHPMARVAVGFLVTGFQTSSFIHRRHSC